MFVELGSFNSEKAQYNQRVEELKGRVTDPAILARNIEEERLKFKGITRKYLASAIAVLKEIFNIDYSLYKIGRDVDANFKTIETTVQKTQTEIANELNVYINQANSMNLDAATSGKLALAVEIIMTYVDDVAVDEDDNKAFYLNHSKIKASSLDLPVTNKENLNVEVTQEVQHNPYANNPVDLNSTVGVEQTKTVSEPLVNPFAGLYGETVSSNIPTPAPVVSSVESAPVVNAADVFGAAAITATATVEPAVVNPQPVQLVQPSSAQTVQPIQMVQPMQPVQSAPLEPVKVNNQTNQLNPEEAIPQGNGKFKGPFVEKNVVVFQVISALILPLLAAIAVFALEKIFEIQFVNDFLADMPTTLQTMSTYIIVITLFVIFGGPVISLAKKRTRYLERFLVAPVLLTLPITELYLEYLPELINSFEVALVLLATIVLYAPFITLLFISAFASLNMEKVEPVKWNIFEKLGMILVIYHFIIPTVYLVLGTFNITLFDEIYSTIYFMDSDSDLINTILTVVDIAIPILIMITRTFQNKRKRAQFV